MAAKRLSLFFDTGLYTILFATKIHIYIQSATITLFFGVSDIFKKLLNAATIELRLFCMETRRYYGAHSR